MVIRLWGTINGWPVEFAHKGGDVWTGMVPRSDTGVWVIALWAEDDAGNVGYYATVRFRYTAKDLGWKIEILGLGAGVTPDDVKAMFGVSGPVDIVSTDDVHAGFEVSGPDGQAGADQVRTSVQVGGPVSRVPTEDVRTAADVRGPKGRIAPDDIRSRPDGERIREESS